MKIADAVARIASLPDFGGMSIPRKQLLVDDGLVDLLRSKFKEREVKLTRPESEYPELIVDVPDSWPHVDLAPLYDVHLGADGHDREKFRKHLEWLRKTKYVLSFNGGDMFDNASKLSIGEGVYSQDGSPQNQIRESALWLAAVRHKFLFSLPGNHEDRSGIMGLDAARTLAWLLDTPYYPDFCMCLIRFAGRKFRLLAHHGTGAANSPGGQRNAARKDVSWAGCFDIFWTGHLHAPISDPIYRIDYGKDDRIVERNAIAVISPSYLRYFGTYAAKKRFQPGQRGLTLLRLNRDGRIDSSLYVHGTRN